MFYSHINSMPFTITKKKQQWIQFHVYNVMNREDTFIYIWSDSLPTNYNNCCLHIFSKRAHDLPREMLWNIQSCQKSAWQNSTLSRVWMWRGTLSVSVCTPPCASVQQKGNLLYGNLYLFVLHTHDPMHTLYQVSELLLLFVAIFTGKIFNCYHLEI